MKYQQKEGEKRRRDVICLVFHKTCLFTWVISFDGLQNVKPSCDSRFWIVYLFGFLDITFFFLICRNLFCQFEMLQNYDSVCCPCNFFLSFLCQACHIYPLIISFSANRSTFIALAVLCYWLDVKILKHLQTTEINVVSTNRMKCLSVCYFFLEIQKLLDGFQANLTCRFGLARFGRAVWTLAFWHGRLDASRFGKRRFSNFSSSLRTYKRDGKKNNKTLNEFGR